MEFFVGPQSRARMLSKTGPRAIPGASFQLTDSTVTLITRQNNMLIRAIRIGRIGGAYP